MSEERICETCKHTELNGCDYPCRWCSVVYPNTGFSDMWGQAGCEFCRGKIEKMPEAGEFNYCFEIEDSKLWAWDAYFDGSAAIKIKFCPNVWEEAGEAMTKSEQIKQMDDDQLASEINNLMSEMCRSYCKGCQETKYRCDEAVLKYLRDGDE